MFKYWKRNMQIRAFDANDAFCRFRNIIDGKRTTSGVII